MSLLMWIIAARCGTSLSLTMGEDGLREQAWLDRLDRLSRSTVAGGSPPEPCGGC
jgi:hypothetical protein